MARKRKAKPTSKGRSERQRIKDRYAHAREDAQLAGLIPTTPEEALGSERVDPATQDSPALPGLVAEAVRSGWATPEHVKPVIVDELVKVATCDLGPLLIRERIAAARTLAQIDRDQWERDNPDRAGQARGGVKVGVQVNNQQSQQVLTPQMVLDAVLAEARNSPNEAQRRLDELARLERGETDEAGPVQGQNQGPDEAAPAQEDVVT